MFRVSSNQSFSSSIGSYTLSFRQVYFGIPATENKDICKNLLEPSGMLRESLKKVNLVRNDLVVCGREADGRSSANAFELT